MCRPIFFSLKIKKKFVRSFSLFLFIPVQLLPSLPFPSLSFFLSLFCFLSGEMETKPAGVLAASSAIQSIDASSIFSGGGDLKRTPSELDLEEFLKKAVGPANEQDVKPTGDFWCQRGRGFAVTDAFLGGVCSDDLDAAFRNPVSALSHLGTLAVSGKAR